VEHKTKDNLIYLGAAGIIVAALASYIFYADRFWGRIPEIPPFLLWGLLSTPVIMGLILERFWQQRRRPLVWVVLFLAASLNIGALVIAQARHWKSPVVFLSMMTAIWVIVIFALLEKLLSPESSNGKRSH
jgi:hypothetical protein